MICKILELPALFCVAYLVGCPYSINISYDVIDWYDGKTGNVEPL